MKIQTSEASGIFHLELKIMIGRFRPETNPS
jgi:hypothetical protein